MAGPFFDLPLQPSWNHALVFRGFAISSDGKWVAGTLLQQLLDANGKPVVDAMNNPVPGDSHSFTFQLKYLAPTQPKILTAHLSKEKNVSGRGIDRQGNLVGFQLVSSTGLDVPYFRKFKSALTQFSVAGADKTQDSTANGMNDKKFVVGSYGLKGAPNAGFRVLFSNVGVKPVFKNLGIPPLPPLRLPITNVTVWGINLQGDFVLTADQPLPSGPPRTIALAYLVVPKIWVRISDHPFFGGLDVNLRGINTHRVIVGGSNNAGFVGGISNTGVIFSLKKVQYKNQPSKTDLNGISDAGWAVGTSASIQPFLWKA